MPRAECGLVPGAPQRPTLLVTAIIPQTLGPRAGGGGGGDLGPSLRPGPPQTRASPPGRGPPVSHQWALLFCAFSLSLSHSSWCPVSLDPYLCVSDSVSVPPSLSPSLCLCLCHTVVSLTVSVLLSVSLSQVHREEEEEAEVESPQDRWPSLSMATWPHGGAIAPVWEPQLRRKGCPQARGQDRTGRAGRARAQRCPGLSVSAEPTLTEDREAGSWARPKARWWGSPGRMGSLRSPGSP